MLADKDAPTGAGRERPPARGDLGEAHLSSDDDDEFNRGVAFHNVIDRRVPRDLGGGVHQPTVGRIQRAASGRSGGDLRAHRVTNFDAFHGDSKICVRPWSAQVTSLPSHN